MLNMKKIYTLLGLFLIAGGAKAQNPALTPIYDFNPDQKHAPGGISWYPNRPATTNQNRTVFYSEDFDAGYGGWENNIQSGNAGFDLTNVGHANNAGSTYTIPTLMTDTPTQWICIDSDGTPGGSYSLAENATLTSQEIDLSAATGLYVALQFDQFFAEWQPTTGETEDHCYIAVSTDSTNWTEVEINEGVGREARPNPELISWDITDFIAGNESTVWFRFRWEGAWNYGWQIDNIEVVDINEKDLMIVDTWRCYSPAGMTYSLVPQAHATEFQIGAIIKNIGHIDQTNVTFDWEIKDPTNATVASGTAADVLSLSNSEYDTILIATGYTPTALGTYTVEWTATSTEGDDNTTDNFVSDNHYELTEYTYGLDYDEGPVEEIDNWPQMTGEAYFGNLFDFKTNDVISGIDVKLTNHSEIVGEEIFAAIFYFPDGGAEWVLLWDNISSGHTIETSDLGQTITMSTGTSGIDVNTTDLYLVTVGQYGSAAMPMFERQGDIGWNYIQGRDQDAANRGFFDRKAPIVRARINSAELGVEDDTQEEHFSVYPNPATDAVNINLVLNNSENTVVNVLDVTGKVIQTINLGNVDGERNISVDLSEIPTGVYFIELNNSNGRTVKKFVKR